MKPLEKLGEILMTQVRDKAIREWDSIIDGRMKGRTANKVHAELDSASPEASAVLSRMIPRIVDTSLHHLLWTLEQEVSLELSVETDDEKAPSVRDESDGLAGELYGTRGWISRFSQERSEEI